MNTLSSHFIFLFFFLVLVSFCSSQALWCRLDLARVWGLSMSRQSIATTSCFFSSYVSPRPPPGITGQEVSILSRSHRAAEAGQPGGRRRRKVHFLMGLSAQSHQGVVLAPEQGYALSGAGLTLGRIRAGLPDNTKWGGGGTF